MEDMMGGMGGMGGMGDMMGGKDKGPAPPPPPPPMQIATKTAKKLVKELKHVLTNEKNQVELKAANEAMNVAKGKGKGGKGKGKEEMESMMQLIAKFTDGIAEKYGFKNGLQEMLGSIEAAGSRKNNTVLKEGYQGILQAIGAAPPTGTPGDGEETEDGEENAPKTEDGEENAPKTEEL